MIQKNKIRKTKSILAKLLATENISVKHSNIRTAYFDLDKRELYCPTWKDMSPELYDLIMGHEVGHAFFTPTEGWHNNVKHDSNFKGYLNVIEDIRIEKLIKNKYPGLKKPFNQGYRELFKNNFFGVSDLKDYSVLSLIDRINLHYKIGNMFLIPFEQKEKVFLDRIENIQSWDDVVSISRDIYNYTKNEETDKIKDIKSFDEFLENLSENFEEEIEFESYSDGERSSDDESDDESYTNESVETTTSKSQNDENYEDIDSSYGFGETESEPESITDHFFRKNETSLVEDENVSVIHVDIPKVDYKNFVFPNEKLYSLFIRENSPEKELFLKGVEECVALFKKNNKKYISLLIKEFESRKNAKQYSRQRESKTGEIDTRLLSKHKISSEIFRKMTVVEKGKSHGMVFYLDLSGSMIGSNITSSVEQILILCEFCKCANIPFVVYGFAESNSHGLIGEKFSAHCKVFPRDYVSNLVELHSSRLKSKDYKNATNFLMIMMLENYHKFDSLYIKWRSIKSVNLPRINYAISFNSTPLNFAVLTSFHTVPKFKKENNLDVVNLVYLTDGAATDRFNIFRDQKIVLRHKETGISTVIESNYNQYFTKKIMEFSNEVLDCNIIGFNFEKANMQLKFLKYNFEIDEFTTHRNNLSRNGYCAVSYGGYDQLYFVKTTGLSDTDSDWENASFDENTTKNDIYRTFKKHNKNLLNQKLIASKFAEIISKNL